MHKRALARVAWILLLPAVTAAEVRVSRDMGGRLVLSDEGSARRARFEPRAPDESLRRLIREEAAVVGVDADLVEAVIRAESAFDPRALSHRGAMGLMQLMPATAADLDIEDPWDPRENVGGGSRYLGAMLRRFDGDLELALAAYNAGPEAVERYDGVPPYPETRTYVRRVLETYHGEPAELAARPFVRGRKVVLSRDTDGRLRLSTGSVH